MAGYDFSKLAPHVSKYMDTDKISIGRSTVIQLPNGSTQVGEVNYTDVPCHITYKSEPNPDPNAIGSTPTIMTAIIQCDVSVDLQAGDKITFDKLAADGSILQTFKNIIAGAPTFDQSRQEVILNIQEYL